MVEKTIFYDAVTFRFIRKQERRRLMARSRRRWRRLIDLIRKLAFVAVSYSFIDLTDKNF
jgi:hypothetical protein